MLKIRIIPCLDVHAGRVVKGVRFVDLVDAGDPVEQAKVYDAAGADELCFLDITASHENRETIYDVVRGTAEQCFMPLTVGGGVRTTEDIRKLLLAGADKVSINTAAVHRPEFVAEASERFGAQCIVVAIDAKMTGPGKWEIFTHGGRKATGIDAVAWAGRMVSLGAGEILLTSMDKDGTKSGFDNALEPHGRRQHPGTADRQRRRRHPRSPRRGRARRACLGRARGVDLPFRRIHHRPGEGAYGGGRRARSCLTRSCLTGRGFSDR